jgi:glucose-6-phosphate 1-epimerase
MPDRDPFAPLVLTAADGARAEVLPYGAHVTSWRPAPNAPGGDAERLYLSARAERRAGAAVRGGVPVCWPQFADLGPLPKHGLVRTRPWTVVRVERDADGAGVAELAIADDDATRAVWPHAFRCTLTVRVDGAGLDVALAVENPGDAPLAFTGALHTYLAVGDVEAAHVRGLEGASYLDKTRDKAAGGAPTPAAQDALAPVGEVDRVYGGTVGPLELDDPTLGRRTRVSQAGWADVVVWTPGEAAGSAIGDAAPGDWRRFLCVEAAAAAAPVVVPPAGGGRAGSAWPRRERGRAGRARRGVRRRRPAAVAARRVDVARGAGPPRRGGGAPVGRHEPHNLHLPYGTDTLLAEHVAGRAPGARGRWGAARWCCRRCRSACRPRSSTCGSAST